jgi:DNA-binding protein
MDGPQDKQAPRPAPEPRSHGGDPGSVCIGRKEAMSYVLAIVTQFRGGAPEVTVKARGTLISRAVDVAEMTRIRFLPMVKPKGIRIGTEDVRSHDGRLSRVSTIEITLARN